MPFSKAKKTPETTLDIVTTQGQELEVVACYKYLGIESSYLLRSHAVVLLNVPSARTVLGTKAFRCAAPLTWNLQK